MSWQDPGSGYISAQAVENSVAYLGATHVRDSVPYNYWTLPEYIAIAQTGVRFDILASGPNIDIAGDIAAASLLESAVPSSIATMEGANEFNTQNSIYQGVSSVGSPPWAQFYGPPLYQAVKNAATLPNTAVIAASMANAGQTQIQQEGDLSSFVDSGNWHVYFGNGVQPGFGLAASVAAAETTTPGRPVTITETGYYTAVRAEDWGGGGVTPQVQAKMTLNILFDAFSDGVTTTYLYELMDNIAHPSDTDLEDSFGLFLANGTPKPAATAVHNLVSILTDAGPQASTFTPGSFAPIITGLPATAKTFLLEKSNGSYYAVVWNEPQIWNEALHLQVVPTSTLVTVQVGGSPVPVSIYSPLLSPLPRRSSAGTKALSFKLGANPIILEVSPAA